MSILSAKQIKKVRETRSTNKAAYKKRWKTLIALECKSSTVTSNPDAPGKWERSNKNNNQIEHPRKWDLKEWSRPTPGTGCLFKEDLISQFTKELSFKKYYDRQQKGPLGSSRCLWHVAGFFREISLEAGCHSLCIGFVAEAKRRFIRLGFRFANRGAVTGFIFDVRFEKIKKLVGR